MKAIFIIVVMLIMTVLLFSQVGKSINHTNGIIDRNEPKEFIQKNIDNEVIANRNESKELVHSENSSNLVSDRNDQKELSASNSSVNRTTVTILNEGFEGTFPSGSWSTSGSPTWDDETYQHHSGSKAAWCAGSTMNPSGGAYANNMNANMVYGSFDLSDADDFTISCWMKLQSEEAYDRYKISISHNNSTWYDIQTGSGGSNTWVQWIFSHNSIQSATGQNFLGDNSVWVRFSFVTDATNCNFAGAWFDDIVLSKEVTPQPPSITVTSPNGGENWVIGTTHNITWNYTNISGNVAIALKTGTTTVAVITAGTACDGSYSWTIPTSVAAGTNYKIAIGDGSGTEDYSNNTFSITAPPQITVTSPNGGESWQIGTTHDITWTYSNVTGNVAIALKTGTTTVAVITAGTACDGSYSWTIPTSVAAGTNYKIAIGDGSGTEDYSNNTFSITAPPQITVTSPNGGESWQIGTTHDITWTYSNVTGNVAIALKTGTTTVAVITAGTACDGSYSWTIPTSVAAGTNNKIAIGDGSGTEDYSNNTFSITAPPQITVIYPNGGENLIAGVPINITWTYSNVTGNVAIALKTGTTTVAIITAGTACDGSYSWTIPTSVAAGTNYKIAIGDGSGTEDYSNNTFSITAPPQITVIYPNGGENLIAGVPINITWTYSNVTGNVAIALKTGTTTVAIITAGTACDGSYSWTIPPSVTGTNYKIFIGNEDAEDSSDGTFNIVSSSIEVTPSSLDFGNVPINTFSVPQSYLLMGNYLTENVIVTPPNGYFVSNDQGGTYSTSLTVNQSGGSVNQTIWVRFQPTENQVYGGNITNISGTASANVVMSGTVPNDDPSSTPVITLLQGNYPNPFNPKTTIRYTIKEPVDVLICVYNIKGNLVKNLIHSKVSTGSYSIDWDGIDNSGSLVSSGIYYLYMKTNNYQSCKKMILMK